jgi:hypothetical protein
MPQRISDVFQVDPIVLREHNVFNGFIDNDSKLYIDPRLLSETSVIELKDADQKVMNYFENRIKEIEIIIEIEKELKELKIKETSENYFYRYSQIYLTQIYLTQIYLKLVKEYKKVRNEVRNKLIFPEIPLAGLGYSNKGSKGKGIAKGIAGGLLNTIKIFVEVGMVDPIIFQLAPIFQKSIGADRMSDMIIFIILPELAEFSIRIAKQLNLPTADLTKINGNNFRNLPCYLNKGILLVPNNILTSLPISYLWSKKSSIKNHNLELRNYMNDRMYSLFATDIVHDKNSLLELIIEHPDMMTKLIDTYKATEPIPYDFIADPENLFYWHDVARSSSQYYLRRYISDILDIKDTNGKPLINEGLLNIKDNNGKYLINEELLERIRIYFTQLINTGLWKSFYRERYVPKKEISCVIILSELLEYHLKNSGLSVKYTSKESLINLGDKYQIILKFTSSPNIIKKCKKLIIENNKVKSTNLYTLLLVIFVDGGKREYEIKPIFKASGIETDFFKIFYIDAKFRR